MADTSNDKREERLKKRREADRRRREAETPEKRHARLDRQKAYRQNLKPTITANIDSLLTWTGNASFHYTVMTSLPCSICAPFLIIIFTILIIFNNDNKYSQPKYIETRKTRGLKQLLTTKLVLDKISDDTSK